MCECTRTHKSCFGSIVASSRPSCAELDAGAFGVKPAVCCSPFCALLAGWDRSLPGLGPCASDGTTQELFSTNAACTTLVEALPEAVGLPLIAEHHYLDFASEVSDECPGFFQGSGFSGLAAAVPVFVAFHSLFLVIACWRVFLTVVSRFSAEKDTS